MRKYLRWIYLVVALAAIAGVLFLGCNPLVKAAPGASDVPEVSQEKRAQAALETLYILKNFYLYDADENVLLDAYKKEQSIEDMIKALDDPLARHMDESEFRTFMDDMKGAFDGIGIVVGIRDGELTIVAPIKDTPGERAGLMPLDKIKHIDGRSTQDMALEYAVSLMKGKKGTTVVLGIERNENETTNTLDVTIVRDTILIPRTSCEMLENQIGYVHLASFFGENTAEEMMEEIKSLLDRDMKGFILDLRLNPGGSVDLAVQVSTKFLPAGTPVVHMVDKNGRRVTYHAGPGEKVDIPMVVLVNEVSASASEIVAGALKDMGRATIVGVKTFGKGSVQTIYPLSDGSAISITTHKYLTAGENSIDKKGIEPDVEIRLPEAPEGSDEGITDTQLEAAIKILTEQLEKQESNKVAG
ncbi:MAG TPA: S41 family peptidase [Firmicutes bacterium]|jgi:carboxyl-terminal processing protease|nr:S41 family peptidase [Bacillota bacterium]